MPETYPKTIHKLPTRLDNDGANHDVLAWVLAKNKAGSYPVGYVLAHNPNEVQPYVVWMVCTRDGGETWHVTGSGQYAHNYDTGSYYFKLRMDGSDLATEALTEPEPLTDEAQAYADENWNAGNHGQASRPYTDTQRAAWRDWTRRAL
jgi:hypothetical protein